MKVKTFFQKKNTSQNKILKQISFYRYSSYFFTQNESQVLILAALVAVVASQAYPKPQYPKPTYPEPSYPKPAYPEPAYPKPAYPSPAYAKTPEYVSYWRRIRFNQFVNYINSIHSGPDALQF